MALSLKDVAANCLGVTAPFSVNSDIYGYIFRNNGTLFGGGTPRTRSLLEQIGLLRDRSINLSIFLVGHENDFSGVVTIGQVVGVQNAIQGMRDIYAQAPLGIRTLFWRRISMAEVGGYAVISGQPEAEDLTDDFSGPNDGIDVFFVQNFIGAAGWSAVNGPCGKEDKDDMTGAVLQITGGDILIAHEVGHYLGLKHGNDITNIMGTDVDNNGVGETGPNSRGITAGQGAVMRLHCTVRGPC